MEVQEEGIGKLFTDPDPDKAREFFRKKSRELGNKLMTVGEAVTKFLKDGDYFAIGGFGANRIPTAICHEIVRQKKRNLAFAGHTSTHDFQILAAGKVFSKCDIAYIIGLEARGLSPNARRYMETGDVEVTEWTNYAMAARLKAAAMGVSFVPIRDMMGTDTFKFSASKKITCPYTGEYYVLAPALYPDFSAIHVHEADVYGNCRIKGITIADLELARASKHLVITCERIISNDQIRSDPSQTVIPFYLVDAVCEVPYGCYPGNMPYEYYSDEEHLREWLTIEKDPEQLKKFLDKNIYNVNEFTEYIELNGGLKKMQELRDKEFLIGNTTNTKK